MVFKPGQPVQHKRDPEAFGVVQERLVWPNIVNSRLGSTSEDWYNTEDWYNNKRWYQVFWFDLGRATQEPGRNLQPVGSISC